MSKYKKKYINLRWFNYTQISEYFYLLEYFKFNYIGKDKAIIKSVTYRNNMPNLIYILHRTSKNCFKIVYTRQLRKEIKIEEKNFKKAKEVLEYIKYTHYKYKCDKMNL